MFKEKRHNVRIELNLDLYSSALFPILLQVGYHQDIFTLQSATFEILNVTTFVLGTCKSLE